MPADYDGDGHAEVAVFRPSTGEWFIRGWLALDRGLRPRQAAPT